MIIPSLSSLHELFLFQQKLKQEEIEKIQKDRQEKTGGGCCGKKRKSFGNKDNT